MILSKFAGHTHIEGELEEPNIFLIEVGNSRFIPEGQVSQYVLDDLFFFAFGGYKFSAGII